MNAMQRRTLMGSLLAGAALIGGWAYYGSLSPAAHPDHDHGVLNIDAGGRLTVEGKDGRTRNLVGKPGHVLVVHLFSLRAPDAPDELKGLFAFQERVRDDREIETVVVARDGSRADLDALLAKEGIVPPFPETIYVDPSGDTSTKFNVRGRLIETMFFNPDGKLASQARGRQDWDFGAIGKVNEARAGQTIE